MYTPSEAPHQCIFSKSRNEKLHLHDRESTVQWGGECISATARLQGCAPSQPPCQYLYKLHPSHKKSIVQPRRSCSSAKRCLQGYATDWSIANIPMPVRYCLILQAAPESISLLPDRTGFAPTMGSGSKSPTNSAAHITATFVNTDVRLLSAGWLFAHAKGSSCQRGTRPRPHRPCAGSQEWK